MAEFESSAVNLGSLFYSQEQLNAGPTAGFHKATYGDLLDHRFNQQAGSLGFKVELEALANLGQPAPPARRPDAPTAS